jgi:hypothetical protein
MPRKSTKNNPVNASEAMEMVLSTEPLKTIEQAAQIVGVSETHLLELFSNALNLPEVMNWEVIPQEHEKLLAEFKNQQDAFNSVRALEPTEPAQHAIADIPELPEEMQIQKVDEHAKKEPTALTQTKVEKLKESDQKAQKLASSDSQIKQKLHARKGQKSGAQLATIELAAEDLTYRKIKGEALLRKVGQLTSEMSAESDFDPIQLLAELGIDSNSEIFEDLRRQIEPALGKLDSAVAEITENAWVNGVNLEVRTFTTRELAQLERTYSRLLVVKSHLQVLEEHQEMSALFPTFLSLGQRLKRLLATDIKSIWQA